MLSLEQARRFAKEIVDENPNFVYSVLGNSGECFYVPLPVVLSWAADKEFSQGHEYTLGKLKGVDKDDPRQKTGCFVDRILFRAGITDQRSKSHFGSDVADLVAAGLIAEEAHIYMRDLQVEQDNGSSWGNAYATAETQLTEPDDEIDFDLEED